MNADKLERELEQFTGTEKYTRFNALYKNLVLTDGALFLANEADAFWLMDVIGSYQMYPKMKAEYFQVWTIQKNATGGATITCTDGNNHQLAKQEIEFTSFPLDKYDLYAIESGELRVILLPSEY